MPKDVYQESVDFHLKNRGKIEIVGKVKVDNKEDLSLAYTPGVAAVSRLIAQDTSKSFSHTFRGNTVAIVSDGSAILGLGNLGAVAALPVMEGKALLFKEFGGIDAFPICLDTQDVEDIIHTVKILAPNFAGINLEDISAPRCFEIEERLKKELSIPVMHDDQHGTAVVVLAGLINALKIKQQTKEDAKIIISGAGAAGTAIAKLLLFYGFGNLIVCDSQGIISEKRLDLNVYKRQLAITTNRELRNGNLAEALVGADVFIGISVPNILTAQMIKTMNKNPVVFALANPIPEIMPNLAQEAGAFIVATGRSDFANQINNVLAFPGIFKGVLQGGFRDITAEMLVIAAKTLAECIDEPQREKILPNPFDKQVVTRIATAIVDNLS